jgi:hypothetical protein
MKPKPRHDVWAYRDLATNEIVPDLAHRLPGHQYTVTCIPDPPWPRPPLPPHWTFDGTFDSTFG